MTEAAADRAGSDAVDAFRALAERLDAPGVLVCPADATRQPATSFQDLNPGNISYKVESGAEVTDLNPPEVLARCPIHGHEIHCDGSVTQKQTVGPGARP